MNYEKQTWERGETISADKLNHIEEGIANSGGTFLIQPTGEATEDDTYVYHWYDKTWKEADDALASGMYVTAGQPPQEGGIVIMLGHTQQHITHSFMSSPSLFGLSGVSYDSPIVQISDILMSNGENERLYTRQEKSGSAIAG